MKKFSRNFSEYIKASLVVFTCLSIAVFFGIPIPNTVKMAHAQSNIIQYRDDTKQVNVPVSTTNPLPTTAVITGNLNIGAITAGVNAFADGFNPTLGETTDPAAVGDVNGSIEGRLRYFSQVYADTWDKVNHAIKITGPVTIVDGGLAALGTTTDAKDNHTDATSVTAISLLKELSFLLQNPSSTPITGTVTINPIPAGANVIGHVITDTGSTTAVTSLPTLPSGTNLIGKTGIDQTTPGTTNAIVPTTDKTVVTAAVDITTATIGDNQIVAGVAMKTIKVVSYLLVVGGATTLKWRDGTSVIVGQMPLVANQGIAAPLSPIRGVYHFATTTTGNALNINSTAAVSIGGYVNYVQE